MKMTDMRAKARAIFGPAIAEPMPKQPNGAKALQERANARPIPTYKVGGSVKKAMPPQPTAAEREADRKRRESLAKSKVTQSEADTLGRSMRSEGPRYKDGGKIAKYKQGTGSTGPQMSEGRNVSSGNERFRLNPTIMRQPSSDLSRLTGTSPPTGVGIKGTLKFKDGGKVQTSADTAKKLATEMGGMKKGGKAKKDGLAVMIAIGSPKKPAKKMDGGEIPMDTRASKLMAAGGAGKTRKGQAPAKFAQGGAGKVRKGMMTPEGQITHAMNKIRGK